MVANYPTIVRKFQNHVDGTEYVMAGHMNAVQDEVTAIESTLGAKPNVFNPTNGNPTAYSTVGDRLDNVQRSQANQQGEIDSLLDASNNGWSLPIANIFASGTNIPPTKSTHHVAVPSDWYRINWTAKMLDTDGIFNGGPSLTVPKSGWWIITSASTMKNPITSPEVTHNVWCRMKVDGTVPYEIAKADSSAPGDSGGWHRLTTACGIELFAGDRVYMEYRHDFIATDPSVNIARSTQAATCRVQLTYVRALPGGFTSRPPGFFLPDELDPND